MGWKIKIKKEKFRIWSTVVDDYITEYITKDELIRFLFWHRFETLMQNMLEDIICFPNNWTDKETGKYLNCDKEKQEEFFEILKDRNKKFEQFFIKIKEAGVSIDLKDIDGVDIHTKSDSEYYTLTDININKNI